MANVLVRKKKNTKVEQTGDDLHVCLHSTVIVSVVGGIITLRSGGWLTSTTKNRMNQTAHEYDLGFSVYADRGEWYVRKSDGDVLEFSDGIQFPR